MRRRRTGLFLAAGLALPAVPSAPAAARTLKLGPAISARSAVVTDGRRWAAFETASGSTEAIDTRAHTAYVVRTASGCRARYGSGGIVAVNGGDLLWTCGPRGLTARVMNLSTRAERTVPGTEAAAGSCPVAFVGFVDVGRDWLGGYCSDPRSETPLYLSRHARAASGGPSAGTYADLNRPGLYRPLCAAVRLARSTRSDPAAEDSRVSLARRFVSDPAGAVAPTLPSACRTTAPVPAGLTSVAAGGRWNVLVDGGGNVRVRSAIGGPTLAVGGRPGPGVWAVTDARVFLSACRPEPNASATQRCRIRVGRLTP